MAWSDLGAIGNSATGSASGGTTIVFPNNSGVTIPAGSLVTLGWCANVAGLTATCSDNSTQTGAANVYTLRPPLAGATFTSQSIYCVTTRDLLAADRITVTTSATTSRKAGVGRAFASSSGIPVIDVVVTAANDATSPVTVGPTGTLGSANDLVLCFAAWKGGAVGAGFAGVPTGWSGPRNSISGGATTRVEENLIYASVLSSGSITINSTYTSITVGNSEILAFKVVSGTAYTQTVTGGLSFTGIRPVVAMQRKNPAVLSFSGAEVAHPTGRVVLAGFAPTGSLSRQLSLFRTLTGALSFTGIVSTATAYARSLAGAVLQPVGAISSIKSVSKSMTGALSFVGSQTRQQSRLLSALFQTTGTLSRVLSLGRSFTASLSLSGSTSKLTSRQFAGASSFVGGLAVASRGALTAVFRPTGSVSHGLPARTLFAGLALAGSVTRNTSRMLVSSLIATGVMHSQYLPPIPPGAPGGGGFGALMDESFFRRYQVASAWRGVKRVKA